MLKGKDLADYAIRKLGTPYFYGSKMDVLTEAKMKQMHNLYPDVVSVSYMEIARKQNQVGKINVDCSGLIGAFRGKQIGSSQLLSTAHKRLPISQINDFAVGTVLWKQGHVGVYIGDGYCVEAKGIRYGTVKTPVKNTKWVYGLTYADMEYEYSKKIVGENRKQNPFKEPTTTVKYGFKGESVMWLQFELNEAGNKLMVDGIFGTKTLEALMKFQQSCKIEVDGICGKITIKNLREN